MATYNGENQAVSAWPVLNEGTNGGSVLTYRMWGYYTAGSAAESYTVSGTPTATNPATGHALANAQILAFW